MKIEVFNEETVPKPVLRLRLRKDGDNVALIAVDREGNEIQTLLTVLSVGAISRWNLNYEFIKKYEIPVDDDDRMQVCH
ncbi:hypothetical protein [Cloacibacillus porcorum]